jgi:hypothetical protein
MEVVPEPNTMSDCKKAFLDDCQWPKHIKDPQRKQIKRRFLKNNNTWGAIHDHGTTFGTQDFRTMLQKCRRLS